MTLSDLLSESRVIALHGPDPEITGLAFDSRRVRPGNVFFALGGQKAHGGAFLEKAFAAGAAGAVVEAGTAPPNGAYAEVEEPRRTLAEAANRWFRHPSRELRVAAVTGTNGKTTTTWMLESIFRAAGWKSGVIGTTGVRIDGETRPSAFTTPESPELQGLLREMVDHGLQAVAMEVSSHALVQRRAFGLECDVAIFTNLTQDHLDYHGTMESYLDAKLMLFDGRNGASSKRQVAVINAEDPAADAIERAARKAGLPVLRASGVPFGRAHDPHVLLEDLTVTENGLVLGFWAAERIPEPSSLRFSKHGKTRVRLPLLGRYNAENAALAYGAALALGLPHDVIVRGLESMPNVPGRLERVDAGQRFQVVVDYAHTPDALERSIAAAREHTAGRVLLVFGCGGDRDRQKRAPMGAIAARGADVAWVTSDNPRSEDPAAIAAEIVAGAPAGALRVELDRRAAIGAAIAAAHAGDLVLIAGKGHETTQTLGDRVLPFDDREVARAALGGGRA
jgi:UDP-N-acetylmuramoyl-L-alanyl-D-glutamate--2,6-diaminopimelate ligase